MERFRALEPKTSERWRVGLALLVALLALPLLLIDYQSGADATNDAVTLSVDQSGELVPTTTESVPETTTSTVASTTIPVDATQVTEALPTTAPPTTLAATTSTAAPTTTEPPASSTPPDSTPPDTTPPATTPPGTAPPDSTPPDTSVPDTTVPPDTTPPDTAPPDTAPPDTQPPSIAGPVTPVPAEAGDPTPDQWWALRECESTNNYAAVNPSGKFRGAYQFSQATWDWVATSFHPELVGEDPAAALPSNQDAMALATTRMQSPGNAWPHCSRVAGIA